MFVFMKDKIAVKFAASRARGLFGKRPRGRVQQKNRSEWRVSSRIASRKFHNKVVLARYWFATARFESIKL